MPTRPMRLRALLEKVKGRAAEPASTMRRDTVADRRRSDAMVADAAEAVALAVAFIAVPALAAFVWQGWFM